MGLSFDRSFALALVAALVGCATASEPDLDPKPKTDAGDASTQEAAVDASVDANPGDSGLAIAPKPGTDVVSAGGHLKSPSYRMVSTLGQSSMHSFVMRSPGYRLQGGLVGATQGK